MKSLFKQLSEEQQEKLKEKAKEFPHSYGGALDKIKSTKNYYELSLLEYTNVCWAIFGFGQFVSPIKLFKS